MMDIFNFPFQSDVWGTVSEWVIIIVTSITAYFLWQTLKSQKEVQQTQNKLLKIEQLRLRENFRPNLKYSRVIIGAQTDNDNKLVISIAVKNISENPVFNFNIVHEVTNGGKFVIAKPIQRTLKLNEHEVLNLLVENKKEKHLNCRIYFSVGYDDVAGTKYTQTVLFDAYGGCEEFQTFDPKIVKEIEL